jgi:hypothetical protein
VLTFLYFLLVLIAILALMRLLPLTIAIGVAIYLWHHPIYLLGILASAILVVILQQRSVNQ